MSETEPPAAILLLEYPASKPVTRDLCDPSANLLSVHLPNHSCRCSVAFTDCCHSGTLLDQPDVQISGPKSDDPETPPQLVDTFTAAAGDPNNRDISCRSLPTNQFLQALGERLGVTVAPDQVINNPPSVSPLHDQYPTRQGRGMHTHHQLSLSSFMIVLPLDRQGACIHLTS